MKTILVLDKGYVISNKNTDTDLKVVNAARVSHDRKSYQMTDKDRSLIRYLLENGHTSPMRHANMTFEIYAPLMVARQWWKYIVGSTHTVGGWNESSRRYVTENEEFYIPGKKEWRSYPENVKQGSGEPVDDMFGFVLTKELTEYIDRGEELYNGALINGVAPEQARLFLPSNGLYVRWHWTASLQALLHFLDERLQGDAQKEMQEYAKAVETFVAEQFPVVYEIYKEVNS